MSQYDDIIGSLNTWLANDPSKGVYTQAQNERAAKAAVAPPSVGASAPAVPAVGANDDNEGGLLGFGKHFVNSGLNWLDTIFGKPFSSALAFTAEDLHNVGRNLTGQPFDPKSPYKRAAAVWNPETRSEGGQAVNDLLGAIPGLGALSKIDTHSAKQYGFSPGNLADLGVSMFGPGLLGKALGEAGNIARGAVDASTVKAGEAAQNARNAINWEMGTPKEVPNVADNLDEMFKPKGQAPSGKFQVTQNPDDYLNHVMGSLKPDVKNLMTVPERRGQKVALIADHLGVTPEEVVAVWPKKNQIDSLADEVIKQRTVAGSAYQAASNKGFNLDDIFSGKLPNLKNRIASDAQKRTFGVYPTELPNVKAPKFTVSDPSALNLTKEERLAYDYLRSNPDYPAEDLQKMFNLSKESIDKVVSTNPAHVELPEGFLSHIPDLSEHPEAMALFGQHKVSALDNVLSNNSLFNSGLNSLSPTLRNEILNGLAERSNGHGAIHDFGLNVANDAVKTGESATLEDSRHAFETTGVHTPITQALSDALTNGVAGSNSGLANLTKAGIAPKKLRSNYIPISINKASLPERLLGSKSTKTGKGVTRQNYNIERDFDTAHQARGAGYKVDNAVTSTVKTLKAHHQDVSNLKILHSIKDKGIQTGEVSKAAAPGLKLFNASDKTNPLNGMYLAKGLHKYVTTEFDRTALANANIPLVSPVLKGYDKLMGLTRNLTLYNPSVHLHNVFGNALLGFGIKPSTYMDAERALSKAGGASAEMQKSLKYAEKTGALHSDSYNQIGTQISRVLKGKQANGIYQKFQNAGLWDREKALRLGVFHDSFQHTLAKGMSEMDAANVARDLTNKHMVDYSKNNLSTFEREVMSRLDPFYKWHKGNYPLQFSRLADPAAVGRYAGYHNVVDNVQRQLTGHGMNQNVGDGKEKFHLQIPLGNGQFISFDPYMPQDEIWKMLAEPGANFGYNRLASPIRELLAQATNQKFYPTESVTPDGREYLAGDKYHITNSSDSTGKQALDRLNHLKNGTLLPPDQPISTFIQSLNQLIGNGTTDERSVPAIAKLLLSLTGGFASPTPISQDKLDAQTYLENQYNAKNALQSLKNDHPGEKIPYNVQKQIAHQNGVFSIK